MSALDPKQNAEKEKQKRTDEEAKKKKVAVLNKPFPYIVIRPPDFIFTDGR